MPTWNYEVVHVHGSLVAHDDAEWVRAQIDDLTDAERVGAPRAVGHRPTPRPTTSTGCSAAIVGVELIVDRLEGKRKLSQNRSDEDRAGAAAGMAESGLRGSVAVHASMRGV